ncbi:MAG: 4-alpha-glucanotransferase [Clostridia bacterium]|nr:4-alpha-glucanotransferase [Clostridia bacterium]
MSRKSGVLMHVSSLYGEYSCGAFGKSAFKFIDVLSSAGFKVWQVLPFCYPDEVGSPYKSFGAFSGNPYFIDLELLYENGLLTLEELESAKQISPYLCEFSRLKNERIPLLKKAFTRFKDFDKLNEFFASHGEILKFCKFMALKEKNGFKPHDEWTFFEVDDNVFKAWQFIEYTFFTQWKAVKKYANSKGVLIIGDMPIYVDYDSSDLYFNKQEFFLDKTGKPTLVAGVPPDYFSSDGQLWGNPLYDFKTMKTSGYKWWKNRISFYDEFFDGVRIDHFRAFESFYAIKPTEKTAKNGKWKKGPGLSFIKTLKNEAKNLLIIAEDLGVITDKVRALVNKSGLPGMRVLQFGFLGDDNSPHLIHNFEKNTVSYTGTHDNNTLLGWMWEQSDDNKKRITEYFGLDFSRWNDCYDDIMRQMLASVSNTVIFPVQDLLKYGSDTRLNTPGVAENNWAFRITENALNDIDVNKFLYYNTIYARR